MQRLAPSQLLVRSAELLSALIGVFALALALERVVLSAKFGELPISDGPSLAVLAFAAVMLCVGHIRRVGHGGHLPVSTVLIGAALACAALVYVPGSPVPALVVLEKPWGALAVALVVVVLSVCLLRYWRGTRERIADLPLGVALAGLGVAVYVWLIGLIVAVALFSIW